MSDDLITGEKQVSRDEHGRFAKGNRSGGRAPVAREIRYYEILKSTVTFADWEEIVKRAVLDAKRGDGVARKWIADYLIGPPVEHKDITSGGEKIKGYVIVSPDDWTDTPESPDSDI